MILLYELTSKNPKNFKKWFALYNSKSKIFGGKQDKILNIMGIKKG